MCLSISETSEWKITWHKRATVLNNSKKQILCDSIYRETPVYMYVLQCRVTSNAQ